MTDRVIELDVDQPWEPDTSGPRSGRALSGRLLILPVVLVALATLTGEAPRPAWTPVLVQHIANLALTFGPDDTAYVAQQRIRSGRLQAYRPGRRTARWTVDFPAANAFPVVTSDPALLIVSVFDANPDASGTATAVQARNARTGELLWNRPRLDLLTLAGDNVVLVDTPTTGSGAPRGGTVEAVDRLTGTTRWSHTIAPGTVVRAAEHDDGSMGELDPDGQLRLIDVATGASRSTVPLRLAGSPLDITLGADQVVVSQVPVLPSPNQPDPLLVAYNLGTGAERWRSDHEGYRSECGDRYLCTYGSDVVTIADPRAGTILYDGPGDRIDFRGTRLLVSWLSGAKGGGIARYDLAAGRPLRPLPRWHLVADAPDRPPLAAQNVGAHRLLVAQFDPTDGELRLLGVATDWIGDPWCASGRRYIGCTGPGGLRIWKLP